MLKDNIYSMELSDHNIKVFYFFTVGHYEYLVIWIEELKEKVKEYEGNIAQGYIWYKDDLKNTRKQLKETQQQLQVFTDLYNYISKHFKNIQEENNHVKKQ